MTFIHYWDYNYIDKILKDRKDETKRKSNKRTNKRKTLH